MATRAQSAANEEKALYGRDFHRWLEQQAALLRGRRLDDIDVANLAEEIEDMGRSEKRAIESNLTVLLVHLLKYQFQPDQRSNSWRGSIVEHRRRLRKLLEDSPSLGRFADQAFPGCFRDACEQAAADTGLPLRAFPRSSPFTLKQTLDPKFLPE